MSCQVVRYSEKNLNQISWGVLHQSKVYEISGSFPNTADFLNEGKVSAFTLSKALKSGECSAAGLDVSSLNIISPITKPCLVLCQGANYRQHMIESGMNPDDKKFNMFFTKSAGSISGPYDDVVKPNHVKLLDYEVELGLVIGKDVTSPMKFDDEKLGEYVAAFVIGNDISARDVQIPQMQFFKGKSYRSFCPLGPVLCLLEPGEIKQIHNMNLNLTVNGEVRQQDSTENLVFKPAESLSEFSQVSDMRVGDVVLTGTPAGCALQVPPPLVVKASGLLPEALKWKIFIKMQSKSEKYLKSGDVIKTTVESADGSIQLGTQINTVAIV